MPTPTVQIIVDKISANGGIAITASHNPSQWNAMKFIGSSGIFLNMNEAAELSDIYNQAHCEYIPEDEIREIKYFNNAFSVHVERIFANIDIELIRKAKFKVAVNCCNGAGALYAEAFLKALGCQVFTLFDEADGCFRRAPEPIGKNISELLATVKDNVCDIGFALDPDADRITVVNEKGDFIGEQYSVVLATEHILSKEPSPASVVVNLATTKAVADLAEKHGSHVFYSSKNR